MALTPADQGNELGNLLARVADLESRQDRLERQYRVTGSAATVTAFIGGSTTCTVQYTATGTTGSVRYLFGYTPVVGHGGVVVEFLANTFFIPASAS